MLRRCVMCLRSSSGDTELSAFIKEGLTDDLLSGLVLASEKSGEPPAQAAARLAALANLRRFEMAWMFVGKAEKAARPASSWLRRCPTRAMSSQRRQKVWVEI